MTATEEIDQALTADILARIAKADAADFSILEEVRAVA